MQNFILVILVYLYFYNCDYLIYLINEFLLFYEKISNYLSENYNEWNKLVRFMKPSMIINMMCIITV